MSGTSGTTLRVVPEGFPEPGPELPGQGAGTEDDRTGPGPVPVADAATALGITERAVRKRIQAGKLRGTFDGRAWHVWLPEPECGPGPEHQKSGAGTGPEPQDDPSGTKEPSGGNVPEQGNEALLHALELVDRLQRQNSELTNQVAYFAGQLGYTQGRLQAAEQKILALTAPVVEQEPERPQAPWWKRLLRLEPA